MTLFEAAKKFCEDVEANMLAGITEYPASYDSLQAEVKRYDYRIRKSSRIKNQEFWNNQPWKTHTPDEIAKLVGCSYQSVISRRTRMFGAFQEWFPRKESAMRTLDYSAIDFSLQDSALAKIHGVTRERIRQIRKKLGKAKSPLHHRRIEQTKMQKAVLEIENNPELQKLSSRQLAKKFKLNKLSLAQSLCHRKIQVRDERKIHNFSIYNWDLPDATLCEVWRKPYKNNFFGNVRCRNNQNPAKWSRRYGYLNPINGATVDEYFQAVKLEAEKAANRGIKSVIKTDFPNVSTPKN